MFQAPSGGAWEPELPDDPDTQWQTPQGEQLTDLAGGQTVAYLTKCMIRFCSLKPANRETDTSQVSQVIGRKKKRRLRWERPVQNKLPPVE